MVYPNWKRPKDLPKELIEDRRKAVIDITEGRAVAMDVLRAGRKKWGPTFAQGTSILERMAATYRALKMGARTPEAMEVYGTSGSSSAFYNVLARYGIKIKDVRPPLDPVQHLRKKGLHLGRIEELYDGLSFEQVRWLHRQVPSGMTLLAFMRSVIIDLYHEENPDA
jgi:hypothetical protein